MSDTSARCGEQKHNVNKHDFTNLAAWRHLFDVIYKNITCDDRQFRSDSLHYDNDIEQQLCVG